LDILNIIPTLWYGLLLTNQQIMKVLKIWKEDDGVNCFKPYFNGKVMRLLTGSICGIHIEIKDVKIHICLPTIKKKWADRKKI